MTERELLTQALEALEYYGSGATCEPSPANKAIAAIRAHLEAAQPEPVRPDILERMTYHALERDDLTLDECLSFLAHGWKTVRGRTEREMVMQILALLAAAPTQPAPDERIFHLRSHGDVTESELLAIAAPTQPAPPEIICERCGDGIVAHNPGICGTCHSIADLAQPAPVTYKLSETDIYDFAGWLTTRKNVMSVGSSCEAGPMAEAVGEYIKAYPERFSAQPAPPTPTVPEALVKWAYSPELVQTGNRWQEGYERARAWVHVQLSCDGITAPKETT